MGNEYLKTDIRTERPEKFKVTGRMKGNGIKRSLKEKADELHESLGITEVTVFEGSILDSLKKLSDRIEAILQEVDISKKPKLTYELELRLDREPEFREYSSYDEVRKVAISILQKGENGWYAKITGDKKVEEFERRGPGVVYQDGKIAIEELTRDEIDQLIGMGDRENFEESKHEK